MGQWNKGKRKDRKGNGTEGYFAGIDMYPNILMVNF